MSAILYIICLFVVSVKSFPTNTTTTRQSYTTSSSRGGDVTTSLYILIGFIGLFILVIILIWLLKFNICWFKSCCHLICPRCCLTNCCSDYSDCCSQTDEYNEDCCGNCCIECCCNGCYNTIPCCKKCTDVISMEDNTMYGKYLNAESDNYYRQTKYGRSKISFSEFREIYNMKQKIKKINSSNIDYNINCNIVGKQPTTIVNQPEKYFPVHGITIND